MTVTFSAILSATTWVDHLLWGIAIGLSCVIARAMWGRRA